jgi:hypothetical protein
VSSSSLLFFQLHLTSSFALHSTFSWSHLSVWSRWNDFLTRTRIKKRNIHKRQWESARLCLARWKVFTALEKHFTRCFIHRTTQKYFQAWKEFHRLFQMSKKADLFSQQLIERRLLFKMMTRWKKHSLLLPWDSPEIRSRVEHLSISLTLSLSLSLDNLCLSVSLSQKKRANRRKTL